jgi:hypothetical protein
MAFESVAFIHHAWDMVEWRDVVNTAMNFLIP